MKKKKAIVALLILLVLAGMYLYRACRASQSGVEAPPLPTAAHEDANAANTDAPSEASGTLTLLAEDDSGQGAQSAPDADAPPPDGDENAQAEAPDEPGEPAIAEDGAYTSRDDVALYIHTYGRLPDNFMTKKEAQALGWEGGGLDDYAYGMCIGGNHYGNYEGLLPEKKGRSYTECDIGTLHRSSRGAKRIVFSNDGLVYYTDDHYDSFTLLYGEE